MNPTSSTELRERYLNRCVSSRDPRAALLAEKYRLEISSRKSDKNTTDSSTVPNLRHLRRENYSSTFPDSSNDFLQSYSFPENGKEKQKAIAKAALEKFEENN